MKIKLYLHQARVFTENNRLAQTIKFKRKYSRFVSFRLFVALFESEASIRASTDCCTTASALRIEKSIFQSCKKPVPEPDEPEKEIGSRVPDADPYPCPDFIPAAR